MIQQLFKGKKKVCACVYVCVCPCVCFDKMREKQSQNRLLCVISDERCCLQTRLGSKFYIKQGNRGDVRKIHVTWLVFEGSGLFQGHFFEKTKKSFSDIVQWKVCTQFQVYIVFCLVSRTRTKITSMYTNAKQTLPSSREFWQFFRLFELYFECLMPILTFQSKFHRPRKMIAVFRAQDWIL